MLIREITHKKCIAFIAEQRLARLACAKDNIPYIIPIYYAHEGKPPVRLFDAGQETRFSSFKSACLSSD